MTTTTINISAIATAGEYHEQGHGCYSDYVVRLSVGEKTHHIYGWKLCGWLRPGADADLDGSGLANWGDSQPGGWRSVDSDGQVSGLVRVDDSPAEHYDEAIDVEAGYGGPDAVIEPSEVPEWQRVIGAIECAEADGDDESVVDDLESEALAIRDELVERIGAAIRAAIDELRVDEPDSEDIFDALPAAKHFESLPVRVGDYLGAGVVLAWQVANDAGDVAGYGHIFWPCEEDIGRALGESQGIMAAELSAALTISERQFVEQG